MFSSQSVTGAVFDCNVLYLGTLLSRCGHIVEEILILLALRACITTSPYATENYLSIAQNDNKTRINEY